MIINAIKEFFVSIWRAFTAAPPTTGQKPNTNIPVVIPPPPSSPSPLLTREQYNSLNLAIFEGRLKVSPYNEQPYAYLREDRGRKNRNKWIDLIINRQGGSLGDAYCQFGQQDKLDAVAMHLKIPRKYFNYPEGGGTQRVFDKVNDDYKRKTPLEACFVTVEYNDSGKGHIEDVLDVVQKVDDDSFKLLTMAFNTNIDGDDSIVRDGQGGGFATRTISPVMKQGNDTVKLRGYVDHYLIYVDAYKKFHNIG